MKDAVLLPDLKPNWLRLIFTAALLITCLSLLISTIGAELGLLDMSENDQGLLRVMSPWILFTCFILLRILLRTTTSSTINSSARIIVLRSLLGRESNIMVDHISGYSAMTGNDGIIIYTIDGRHFQLSEWTTTRVLRFAESLNKAGVPFLGFEWVWWPFQKSKYRYDPK